jgi:hypothetical protein
LTRENDKWLINDKFTARTDLVNTLLFTIHKISVKSPVPNSAMETVIKNMASTSIKVSYRSKNKDLKVIYVGKATQDGFGTYMLLENSNVPFVTEIKGHNGYLSSRFFTEEHLWRDTKIFTFKQDEIESITYQSFKNPDQSFEISGIARKQFVLKSLQPQIIFPNIDTTTIITYVTQFKRVAFEFYADDMFSENTKDSIQTNYKNFELSVKLTNGKKYSVKAYFKPNPPGSEDNAGEPMPFDVDRMFATVFDDQNFVVIQYFVFDPLTPPIKSFLKQKL